MANNNLDSYSIIKHPVSTEKAVRLMEKDNKLTFIVNRKSNKQEIKKALEQIYKIKRPMNGLKFFVKLICQQCLVILSKH